ncbi:MAG: T9SS type A sorting domain-containing protein [Saprospiraceae bacterium]
MFKIQILLTVAALQFYSRSTAQVAEFAPVGAKWYYSEQAFFPPPFGVFPHIVEVVAKEVYQGKLCSKLIGIGSTSAPSATVPDPLYVYEQNDSVFFYSQRSGRFELLYDFNAVAGDTWVIGGLGRPSGYDSLTVHVDSIGVLLANGKTFKVLHISYPILPYEWGYEIIAGVGNTFFLTPDWGLFEGGPMGLRCYTDAENELQLVPYPCDTTIIISQVQDFNTDSGISINPNPFNDRLTIALSTNLRSPALRLFDAAGRLVLEQRLVPGVNEIETGALPQGLYIWEVLARGERVKAGKIAKHER